MGSGNRKQSGRPRLFRTFRSAPPRDRIPPPSGTDNLTRAVPTLGSSPLFLPAIGFEDDFDAPYLFRFLEEAYADAFVRGDIRLSTLEACRRHEGHKRRDTEEGVFDYYSDTVVGEGGDPAVQLTAARLGHVIGAQVRNVRFVNNKRRVVVPDAYVLCMTERVTAEAPDGFQPFGVRINNPRRFFRLLTHELRKHTAIEHARLGRVTYTTPTVRGTDPLDGSIGFVKSRDRYADQTEVRAVWYVEEGPLQPLHLRCPGVTELLSRV